MAREDIQGQDILLSWLGLLLAILCECATYENAKVKNQANIEGTCIIGVRGMEQGNNNNQMALAQRFDENC
jgi:hypothetical protein